jgi:hypothetical protein
MGTQGDAYLRGLLGNDASTLTAPNPTTGSSGHAPPPAPDPAETQTEIDADSERAREAEQKRVADGPPSTFDQLAQWTTDASTGGTGGGGGPGSFQFSPEAISTLISQWEALYEEIRADGVTLRRAADGLLPPSPDQPATQQAQAAAISIAAAESDNLKKAQYAQNYIDALKKANGTYVQHEDDASTSITNTGSLYDN